MRIVCICFILVFFTSCSKKEREYYDDGSISKEYSIINNQLEGVYKEYYPNKNLKKVCYYSDGKLRDSIVNYYDNIQNSINSIEYILDNDSIKKVHYSNEGIKEEEGIYYKNKKVGDWFSYYKNGVVSKKIEYLDIAGKEYANQGWYYNEKGEPLTDTGNYIKFEVSKDTVDVDEPIKFLITLSMPLFSFDSEVFVCIPKENINDLKKDFSNINDFSLDTLPSLKNQKLTKAYDQYNLQVAFGLKIPERGDYNLRGFLVEIYPNYENSGVNNEKYDMLERKIYFDKRIYVK